MRILIVDDEPNIVTSLEFLMARHGHEVRVASDGEAALLEAERFDPDLVLLDVMLPRRNGYEVCRALRENPRHAGMKILMLTAKGRDAERAKGLGVGADAYVTKPFSTSALVERVEALLTA